jgi:aminoglycoside phosphotransferase (APT) family kinase protein
MLREYQILHALTGSDVPHPAVVGVCEDHSVLGCTFYLMQRGNGATAVPVRTATITC